jgi:hypothetical protein
MIVLLKILFLILTRLIECRNIEISKSLFIERKDICVVSIVLESGFNSVVTMDDNGGILRKNVL